MWSTAGEREQEGTEIKGEGTREMATSEKGSHSGQLIIRELTHRFQYHFFHTNIKQVVNSISDEPLRAS